MRNKIIEESIRIGIPVQCEYLIDKGIVYKIEGFYRGGSISIQDKNGELIAISSHENTVMSSLRPLPYNLISSPEDIVGLNYSWWQYSKHKYTGWEIPSELWKNLFELYGFTEKEENNNVIIELPILKDWGELQEEAYEECMDKLINDDAPITAFIEWLQKNYPYGVRLDTNR